VTETVVAEVTGPVFTDKLLFWLPTGIASEAGSVTSDGSLVESATIAAVPWTVPLRVTVTDTVFPPTVVIGFSLIDATASGVTVTPTLFVNPPYVAETVAAVDVETVLAVSVMVAEVVPAGTVTDAGIDTTAEDELRVMTAPPAGAAPLSVNFAVAVRPLMIDDGDAPILLNEAGLTVSFADLVAGAPIADIVTIVFVVTGLVVTENVALVSPAATVTFAGTVATAALSDDNETMRPPAGAATSSLTVAVDALPPITLEGERLSA
jgi:hypothetical protein